LYRVLIDFIVNYGVKTASFCILFEYKYQHILQCSLNFIVEYGVQSEPLSYNVHWSVVLLFRL